MSTKIAIGIESANAHHKSREKASWCLYDIYTHNARVLILYERKFYLYEHLERLNQRIHKIDEVTIGVSPRPCPRHVQAILGHAARGTTARHEAREKSPTRTRHGPINSGPGWPGPLLRPCLGCPPSPWASTARHEKWREAQQRPGQPAC